MKSLNTYGEALKSKLQGIQELTKQQQKEIKGGYYFTRAECEEGCGGWNAGTWPHGPGPSGKSKCYAFEGPQGPYYDCMDS